MSYSVQNIRNVCLLGHGGSGKTSLAESLLYMTGAIDRMGKPADGNTVCDYDAEETRRQISISTSVAPLEYKGCKINILDTPGSFDFSGEVLEALQVSDAAIIVCSAKDGISVGLEKAWRYCEERDMPRFIYISKTDEENSDYNATFDALRERFGNKIAPIVVPIWDDNKKVTGIIDVLNKRAYEMQNGKRVEIELPEGKEDVVTQFNDALKESVAETSEEFMDKFFSGEDFTYVEMIQGLRQGVRELSLFPVLCGSAVSTMGSLMLMDNIVELLPNPVEGNMRKGMLPSGDKEEYAVSPGGVPSAFVFKTVSDQYGKYSFIKVISGTITSKTPQPTPAPAPPRSWAGCTPCGARRPWRSRSSPAAISAPSASWRRSRPVIPCVTPARSSSCPPSPSLSPATPWPSCPRPGGRRTRSPRA